MKLTTFAFAAAIVCNGWGAVHPNSATALLRAVDDFDAVRQVSRAERFERGKTNLARIQEIDDASWVWCPGAGDPSFVRFRCPFAAVGDEPLMVDVSADERFILYLDGREIARGPHRGQIIHWNYSTYEIRLDPGEHVMEAVVWHLGAGLAPMAQMSLKAGFVLKASGAYDAALTTGKGKWKAARLSGTGVVPNPPGSWYVMIGGTCDIAGTAFAEERPDTSAYRDVFVQRGPIRGNQFGGCGFGWLLFPTERPDPLLLRCRPGAFKAARNDLAAETPFAAGDAAHPAVRDFNTLLAEGRPVTVPPKTKVRLVWNLGDYFCGYPELRTAGGKGSKLVWGWAESLTEPNCGKGDRQAFVGKRFIEGTTGREPLMGYHDVFRPDGRADGFFTTHWWRCGLWCQLAIETADEPLTLNALGLRETRYPLEPEGDFACDDPSIESVRKICIRGLQECMHETFMDCPHWEQQMYPGDSRVEFLALTALSRDDRLVRFALSTWDWARRENGLVPMQYPTSSRQESVTYTLAWAMALGDYALWHDNRAWLKSRLPGLRHTLSGVEAYADRDGLLADQPGWTFVDWVKAPGWDCGYWKDAEGPSALVNLLYVAALESAATVEAAFGNAHLAAHWREKAASVREAIVRRFWDEGRGALADDVRHRHFSEHAQALGVITQTLTGAKRDAAGRALAEDKSLAQTSVFFSHYLFEAYFALGRTDLFVKRLDLWRDYVKLGMKTPLEAPGGARSDCHAWGAHPLYHLNAGVAGIRPDAPFFAKVRIAPQPGMLRCVQARTPHPGGGLVAVDLTFEGDRASGSVTLPGELTGTFVWNGRSIPLNPGRNEIK